MDEQSSLRSESIDDKKCRYVLKNGGRKVAVLEWDVSEKVSKLSGYTREELYECAARGDITEFTVYPPDRAALAEKLCSLAEKRLPLNVSFDSVGKNGGVLGITLTGSVTSEENGCPVYDCVFDYSAEQSEFYQSIIEGAAIGIIAEERPERRVLYINDYMREIFGLQKDAEIVGRKICDISPVNGILLTQKEIEGLRGDRYAEFHRLYGNGKYYTIRARAIENSGIDSCIAYVTDETKEYEKHIKQKDMLNRMPAGIGLYEIDEGKTEQLYLNDGFYAMIGEDRETYAGRIKDDFTSIIEPDDRPAFNALFDELVKGSSDGYADLRLMCGDGRYRWFRLTASAASRDGGKIGVYCVYSDCDEMVEARNALEKTKKGFEAQYEQELAQRLFLEKESAVVMLFNLTRDELVEYRSSDDVFARYKKGMTSEEIIGDLSGRLPSGEQLGRIKDFFDASKNIELFKSGVNERTLEYRSRQNDGCLYWLRAVCRIKQDARSGDFQSYTCFKDIDIEKKLALAADSAIDEEIDYVILISVVNHRCRMIRYRHDCNLPCRKIGGEINIDDITNKERLCRIFDEDMENVLRFFDIDRLVERLKDENVITVTYRITCGDDQIRRKKIRGFYLDETHEDIVVARRDITDLYEEEQAQNRRLESANDAKTAFLSRVSHDMRTPLNGILGITYLARDCMDINELKNYMELIESSGQLLLNLVNDTLDMNRIESGKLELHPAPCDEKKLFEGIFAAIEPDLKKKKLNLHTQEIGIDWKKMTLDVPRFQQVFINLFSNAIKFTPEGGDIYWIMECLEDKPDYVVDRFIVRDNGVGMSAEFQKQLFEPFTQENRINTDRTVGTGLGLSIVKRIVELMNGTITVKSSPGKGSEFTIILNLPVIEAVSVKPAEPEAAQETLAGKRVLLCEDNPLNIKITTRLLEKKNMLVEAAENGRIGADKFAASAARYYDAVLMDIRMPVLDGLGATMAIRALDRPDAKAVPIIAMSANAFNEDIRKSLEAGMNTQVAKPVDPPTLFDTLAREIQKYENAPVKTE